jgi:SnoaL-like domain
VPDTRSVIDNYIAMWNETDPDKRRNLVAETVTEDAGYIDPVMTGDGIDGIDGMIAAAQQQFPGHSFTLSAGPDVHHDRVRFSWSLAADGSEPVAAGTDFATIAEDGRLSDVTGFLDSAGV